MFEFIICGAVLCLLLLQFIFWIIFPIILVGSFAALLSFGIFCSIKAVIRKLLQ